MQTAAQQEEATRLREQVESLKKMLGERDAQIERQRIQIENLTQAVLHARKKMYGPSSEAAQVTGQLNLFPEQERLLQELAKQQKEITAPEHTRKVRPAGVRSDTLSSLETEIERCVVSEEEACPVCGAQLTKAGEKAVRTEVLYEPAKLKVKQYVQEIKKCIKCGSQDSEKLSPTFAAARVPKGLLPHSIASPSLVAGILYQKYDMGIPLAKQERDWYRIGLSVCRSTMSHWAIRCSQEWLEPIFLRMHQVIMETCSVLMGDETRIQCNKEPGKKASSESFMWVVRTGSFEEIRAALFHYARTRSGAEAKRLYSGFDGYLVTDACDSYEKAEGVTRALCWSHLRRHYIESIPLDSAGKKLKGSKGAEAREWRSQLFKIEKKIQSLDPQERLEKRKELSQPILEAFWSWVEETSEKYTANESLKKAPQYSRNQKKYLNTFMEDGRLPISNNECEACIRPFATGRKSWLFADTPEEARASGIVYSLAESSKLNQLDVFRYLSYLLEKMPEIDYQYQNDPSILDPYLPWSRDLPEYCGIQKKKK